MAPRHRCSRTPYRTFDGPLDYLGPDGPLHPDVWPLRTVDDVFDAIDLSRPETFDDGLIVLLLDSAARPVLAMAVSNAPEDDIDAIATVLSAVREEGPGVAGVVLGVYRPTRTVGSKAIKMTIDGTQLAAWMSLSRLLHDVAHESRQTVIVVTHDIRVASQADRLIVLLDGKVRFDGRPDSDAEWMAALKLEIDG